MRLIKKFVWHILGLLAVLAILPVGIFLLLLPFIIAKQFDNLAYIALYLPLIALVMVMLDEIH